MIAITRSVVSKTSSWRTGKPCAAAKSSSNKRTLNSFQKTASTTSATPPSDAITITSWVTSAAACPNRNLSRPAWVASGRRWMIVKSTSPTPKKTDRMRPSEASNGVRLRRTIAITASVPTHPAMPAPSTSTSGAFEPVSRNARAMPGSAAWLMASPRSDCPRSTANVPSDPLTTPSTAAPSATVRSV